MPEGCQTIVCVHWANQQHQESSDRSSDRSSGGYSIAPAPTVGSSNCLSKRELLETLRQLVHHATFLSFPGSPSAITPGVASRKPRAPAARWHRWARWPRPRAPDPSPAADLTRPGGEDPPAALPSSKWTCRSSHGLAATSTQTCRTAWMPHPCHSQRSQLHGAWCWCAMARAHGTQRGASRAAATGQRSHQRESRRQRPPATWCARQQHFLSTWRSAFICSHATNSLGSNKSVLLAALLQLKDDTFGALYVSPLARARQTAEVIMGGQGVQLEPRVLPALREVDLYSFQASTGTCAPVLLLAPLHMGTALPARCALPAM